MKILWLCNIMLPKVSENLSKPISPIGGWLVGMSEELLKCEDIELIVLFPVSESNIISGNVDKLRYYGFPRVNDTKKYFNSILKKEVPDIIHIFGTEFKHTLDMVESCIDCNMIDRVVINIQGLVSVYSKHYYAGLPNKVIYAKTFFELLKGAGIKKAREAFKKRGEYEIAAIKKAKYIIGRTDWDYACVKRINPDAEYLFCNESLRDSFYENGWEYDKCRKHSIFVSQCSYPIKGFHMILEAMNDVLKIYPDAHIYTTGVSPFSNDLKSKLKMTSYRKYLGKLIKKYNLEDKVTFLGSLSEKEMLEQYLKANVFVSASSIENSPNSVGEAMILGVPTVSSDVGGVKNMLEHDKEGYIYPFDEPYMLAHYICKIFNEEQGIMQMTERARCHAQHTHDRKINLKTMIDIYESIMGE